MSRPSQLQGCCRARSRPSWNNKPLILLTTLLLACSWCPGQLALFTTAASYAAPLANTTAASWQLVQSTVQLCTASAADLAKATSVDTQAATTFSAYGSVTSIRTTYYQVGDTTLLF